ncbi:asparagine synthase (glutamine-hydrolyzing) [Desulfitobacterium metallireducens]|uniref:asparagine synthase (glutamine-hydrolyzing) n=1 Tax=Desulfitobacterium metallireducens DSM 15288 TaxID=871968 RepID=W0EDJ3_9FIRM|nr:asparagine synthase (glutamine-hydrolyzing) [Desulfitobacterium metallireducens]AHF07141.1 asparagine synthase [Desulfitobacterium metallireducens DSM 15288]
MCGIVGWVDWKANLSRPESQHILTNMTQTLIPRGPDAEGYWYSSDASFGHRRLVVIDPKGGLQPMLRKRGENEFVLIYNGELYNTPELRRELLACGYHFEGHSDTEVLLLSYLEWGPACVERFNGIFAFGIWDSAEQQLFLARDRLGVKPLFYKETPNGLLFASELKALLANPDVEPEVDAEGLSEILFIGPARTPGHGVYRGINELKPGHTLRFSRSGLRTIPYWSLPSEPSSDNLDQATTQVRELFLDAVKRQLVSDVPLGTLLSGGLDSSAITAIAAQTYAEQGRSPLQTFSIDYLENEKYFQANSFQPNSDAPWIQRVSQEFGTNHYDFKLDTPELVQALRPSTQARDLPGMADVDSSLQLFASQIKKVVTVGLSGECADEIFGGYPWFHRPETLAAETFPWAIQVQNRLQVFSPELLTRLNPTEYLRNRYQEALTEVPHPEKSLQSSSAQDEKTTQERRIREISYLTITRFMPTLLDRKDRMTMSVGLEGRVPFCDHRLAEYAWNLPWEIKSFEGREKGILRRALEGILPHDVLWRKKSPYPKTHNPSYLKVVRSWLLEILADSQSPLLPLINRSNLMYLIKISDNLPSGHPWFGQLMDIPQLFAYLIQLNLWLENNKVKLNY